VTDRSVSGEGDVTGCISAELQDNIVRPTCGSPVDLGVTRRRFCRLSGGLLGRWGVGSCASFCGTEAACVRGSLVGMDAGEARAG
jgi:hypothetical protein